MYVELTEKLMKELFGIFNWALEGYKRLKGQAFIFSESPSMQKSKKRYKQKNSSVADFADAHLPEMFESKPICRPTACCRRRRRGARGTGGGCADLLRGDPDGRIVADGSLESEGYVIENSRKHANQLRIYENELRF